MTTTTTYRGVSIRMVHAGAVPGGRGLRKIHVFRGTLGGAPLSSASLTGMESLIDAYFARRAGAAGEPANPYA